MSIGTLVAAALLAWRPPSPSLARRDRRRPGRPPAVPRPAAGIPVALVLDLVAAVLESGLPPPAALRCVAAALRARTPGPRPPGSPADLAEQMDREGAQARQRRADGR